MYEDFNTSTQNQNVAKIVTRTYVCKLFFFPFLCVASTMIINAPVMDQLFSSNTLQFNATACLSVRQAIQLKN